MQPLKFEVLEEVRQSGAQMGAARPSHPAESSIVFNRDSPPILQAPSPRMTGHSCRAGDKTLAIVPCAPHIRPDIGISPGADG
jgi:hypothetical protein